MGGRASPGPVSSEGSEGSEGSLPCPTGTAGETPRPATQPTVHCGSPSHTASQAQAQHFSLGFKSTLRHQTKAVSHLTAFPSFSTARGRCCDAWEDSSQMRPWWVHAGPIPDPVLLSPDKNSILHPASIQTTEGNFRKGTELGRCSTSAYALYQSFWVMGEREN